MEINSELNNNYVTYGSIVSFQLDNVNENIYTTLSYDPNENPNLKNKKKQESNTDYLFSREFLYSHGVFDEYCFFHKYLRVGTNQLRFVLFLNKIISAIYLTKLRLFYLSGSIPRNIVEYYPFRSLILRK